MSVLDPNQKMHGYLQNQMQYKPLGWCHLVSVFCHLGFFSIINCKKRFIILKLEIFNILKLDNFFNIHVKLVLKKKRNCVNDSYECHCYCVRH